MKASLILTDDEIAQVRRTVLASHLLQNPRWREESAIHFVCQAAERRGNSYSRTQIIVFVKIGLTADRQFSEAEMLAQLGDAYDEILSECDS